MDMNEKLKFPKTLITVLITIIATLLICVLALAYFLGGFNNFIQVTKFAQTLGIIETAYVGDSDLDEVTDDAISAAVYSLDDKWSYYMTAEEYDAYQLRASNTYRGIGVTVSQAELGFNVKTVSQETPAFVAGIVAGDILTEIDGESLVGWQTAELQTRISDYDDEEFTLTVLSENGETKELILSTTEVETIPIEYELIGDVGYIKMINFRTGLAEQTIAAIEELREQGAKAIIFDVRYNGGGYVHEMTDLLDYLLPEGTIFESVSREGGSDITESDAEFLDMPMAVLVNAESHSAAELFAKQLSEYDAATIVGVPTTGKGRSQINIPLIDGSVLHISTQRYLTSEGLDLSEEGGMIPDVVVEISDEELAELYYGLLTTEDDKQLQAALELF